MMRIGLSNAVSLILSVMRGLAWSIRLSTTNRYHVTTLRQMKTAACGFCRAAYTVMQYPSVGASVTFVYSVEANNISLTFFTVC